eukprot:TRINITY_DN8592_c0_g1_i1.p1 TRINITY_DN8592_c0_g1~~TRINITY_DN8592_c0_g1_i1.p1  ORF type:complete len:690 (+),score=238.63 TRINITY_DN8592_c0_g1_i1:92-2071(+)
MPPRQTKTIGPQPVPGAKVLLRPEHRPGEEPFDLRPATVVAAECSSVRVRFDGDAEPTAISRAWWDSDAFISPGAAAVLPLCELCGGDVAALSRRLLALRAESGGAASPAAAEAAAASCGSCAAVALLELGRPQAARARMRDALAAVRPKEGDDSVGDALLRHCAALRTAVGLLGRMPTPQPLAAEAAEAAQVFGLSSLDAFAASWKHMLRRRLENPAPREREMLRVMLDIFRLKRAHGDGWREEAARRRAEESEAWRTGTTLRAALARAEHGATVVRQRAAEGRLSPERLAEVIADNATRCRQMQLRIAEHEARPDWRAARGAIDAYARWFHGTGIAALQHRRARLMRRTPSVSGQYMEELAAEWLAGRIAAAPPPGDGQRRVLLTNVTFRNVAFPGSVSSEFDAFVVLCRPRSGAGSRVEAGGAPPPSLSPAAQDARDEAFRFAALNPQPRRDSGGGAVHPVAMRGVDKLWEVTALEQWVEVKTNPDECLEAWARHRTARAVLSEHAGCMLFEARGERYWFPGRVFAEFTAGVTFVTTPGAAPVVWHGSNVPKNFFFPGPMQSRLFQFAFERLHPPAAPDPDDPLGSSDYIPELYRRLDELFMHEGADPQDFRGYAQDLTAELRDITRRGQVFIVDDPFRGCYPQQAAALATPTSPC